MQLPQPARVGGGRARGRVGHWAVVQSLPRRCMRIGRRRLRRRAELGVATLRRASGGPLGRPDRFYSSASAELTALPTAWLVGPPSLSEDATKWRRRGAEPLSELVPVPGPTGCAGDLRAAHMARGASPGMRPGGAGSEWGRSLRYLLRGPARPGRVRPLGLSLRGSVADLICASLG